MSWYEDDFYNEPSEFEIQMEEFKKSLAKAIRSEFLEEMKRLKKENRNLQGIKEHFEQIKMDYERKKLECDRAIREAEDKAKRMKVDELMKRFKTFFWMPDWEYLYGPKCDKCDKDRRIEVVLPSGKTVKDECQCGKSRMKVMIPERMVRYSLEDRDQGVVAWYIACGQEESKYYNLDHYGSVFAEKNMVQPGTSFDVLEKKGEHRPLLFSAREECLAYCEYLNKKNGVTSDVIYKADGELYEGEEESE